MKKKLNRNILWTETFASVLASLGVKYVSLSPGSRNTPLTFAFVNNKKFKSFVHIDERSSGFFALGLAKSTATPVVIVCTSGTATAELYPAIIEAYQQRVPLIVCTADRPPGLRNRGANQTINQQNLYHNHIRQYFDAGLPTPTLNGIRKIKNITLEAFEIASREQGPVHINFPFNKPFEPDSYTDEVDEKIASLYKDIKPIKRIKIHNKTTEEPLFKELIYKINRGKTGLIIAGPGMFKDDFKKSLYALQKHLGIPILADGASQLRFGKWNKNVLTSYESFLRAKDITTIIKPDFIIQFGRTVTSKAIEEFLKKSNTSLYIINEYGDLFDPSEKARGVIAANPILFCKQLREQTNKRNDRRFYETIERLNNISLSLTDIIIGQSKFPSEGRIVREIITNLPDNSEIMISNSMPIRDFDYFANSTGKKLTVYCNRGASGIDGIISTGLGIASLSKKDVYLITGDLAFFYDITALITAKNYKINITIILINNNGGGIFEVLPVSGYKKVFVEYFKTPHNLEFSNITKVFGGKHYRIKNWRDLGEKIKKSSVEKGLNILEIRTNARESNNLRKKLWKRVSESLNTIIK